MLGIRPEDLEDCQLAGESAHGGKLGGTVTLREALGSEIMVHFSVDAQAAITEDVKELAEDVGDDRVAEGAGDTSRTVLVGRFGARASGPATRSAIGDTPPSFFDRHGPASTASTRRRAKPA